MDIAIANNSFEYGIYRANQAMSAAGPAALNPQGQPANQLNMGDNAAIDRVVARSPGEYGVYMVNRALKQAVGIELTTMRQQVGSILNQFG